MNNFLFYSDCVSKSLLFIIKFAFEKELFRKYVKNTIQFKFGKFPFKFVPKIKTCNIFIKAEFYIKQFNSFQIIF